MRGRRSPLRIRYMELLLVFLSTAIGTVAGVAAGLFFMARRSRASNMGSDSILRTQLQNTEWALASAGRDVEELRKQLEQRQSEAQQARSELEGAQRQLLVATAELEKETSRRAEMDELAAKGAAEKEALAGRVRELEASAPSAEEAQQQAAALARQIEEERERATALAAELEGVKAAFAEADARRTALEAEVSAERERYEALAADVTTARERMNELTAELATERDRTAQLNTECAIERERTAALAAELARLQDVGGQAQQDRETLELQLRAEQDRLTALAAELEAARASLQQERDSAAEGMKLLLLAQSKLSGTPAPAPMAPAPAANGYANGTAA